MNNIAFLVPIYPPDYEFAKQIIKSWENYSLNQQADIWFVFTNDEEKDLFIPFKNTIVIPKHLRRFENKGIINIKKLYGINVIKNSYEYIIVIDSETEFVKNVNLKEICEFFFNNKILYGNFVYQEGRKRTEAIKQSCKEYFNKYKHSAQLNSDLYLWFNQPCIYKTSTIDNFFNAIDYNSVICNLRWNDFDYYLYMYYLILFENFTIVDIGIDSNYGICEADIAMLTFRNSNYLKANIYMCSKAIFDKFDNPKLFMVIHMDRDTNSMIRVTNIKVEETQTRLNQYLKNTIKPLNDSSNLQTKFTNEFDKIENIDFKEISVVVQGAINKCTHSCLKSIRKYLPGSEIILSTWKGSNLENLDYDNLVLNDDPGAIKMDFVNGIVNNQNRQLISTQNGLKVATRKYILKLRSDMDLNGINFLNYWNKFSRQNEKYKIFNHKILVSSVYSREFSCKNGTGAPTPFHPSDFWFFGLREDIIDYFKDTKLATNDELGDWNFKYPNRLPYTSQLWRYSPEQYFCVNWVKKYYKDLQFSDWSDWNIENIKLSKNILYNNFIFLGIKESNIFCPKHNPAFLKENLIQGLITYNKFQQRYKKYCDINYEIPLEDFYIIKLRKHVDNLSSLINKICFIKFVGECFSVLYYFIKSNLFFIKNKLVDKKTKDENNVF